MRFDLAWLAEHLDGTVDADRLAAALTGCGLLVEVREPAGASEVWDVDVTTNRPDAMNHRGLAREAATALGGRLRELVVGLTEAAEPASARAAVAVAAPELCRRYCARVVTGVRVGPSPAWLADRLERCGVRPVNAVVDATNYVLLELGQPLHAFDLDRLHERRIVVRLAAPGEKLTTLDGEQRSLAPDTLVVADGRRPVAVAGVMGGADAEIHAATTTVLLESAHFAPLAVRRTARRLGLHTEASHRFERGADPGMVAVAVDRAAALVAELAGGAVLAGRVDVVAQPYRAAEVELDLTRLDRFAGLAVDRARVMAILTALELAPRLAGDRVTCTIPSFRVDLERAADLYEEVIRHIGYDAVPAVLPPTRTGPGRRHANWELVDRGRLAAVAAGLDEVMTYTFIDASDDELAGQAVLAMGASLPLANPLAQTQGVMRRSLLPGLLAAARESLSHGVTDLAVFEQGKAFAAGPDGPVEAERLGVAMAGPGVDFARLKGVVEAIFAAVAMPLPTWRRGGAPWLDDAEGAVIAAAGGRAVGSAGRVAAAVAKRWDLRQPVYVAEVDLTAAPAQLPLPRFTPLPRHPAVAADMTVEHAADLVWATLEGTVRELAGSRAERVELVVRFAGGGLPAGVVRTTVRVVYRHPERSLTQDEVNRDHEELRRRLAERLGVRLV